MLAHRAATVADPNSVEREVADTGLFQRTAMAGHLESCLGKPRRQGKRQQTDQPNVWGEVSPLPSSRRAADHRCMKLIFGKTFAASHKRALASLWRRRFKPFLVHASEELVGQFLR